MELVGVVVHRRTECGTMRFRWRDRSGYYRHVLDSTNRRGQLFVSAYLTGADVLQLAGSKAEGRLRHYQCSVQFDCAQRLGSF